jgi:hypothetical protein
MTAACLLSGCAGSVLDDALAGPEAIANREDAYCKIHRPDRHRRLCKLSDDDPKGNGSSSCWIGRYDNCFMK